MESNVVGLEEFINYGEQLIKIFPHSVKLRLVLVKKFVESQQPEKALVHFSRLQSDYRTLAGLDIQVDGINSAYNQLWIEALKDIG